MNRYLPKQHGAWAMLFLPFLLGLYVSNVRLVHIPLLICWVIVYLCSYPVLQWVKTGKRQRYAGPVLVYSLAILPLAVILLWHEWRLIGYGAMLMLFFIPNIYFAKTKNERALLNDIIAILMFCSFIYPVAYLGGIVEWHTANELFVVAAGYFVGTALYVKTMIREKNNPSYYKVSLLYHALFILGVAWITPLLAIPALLLLIRAAVFPKRGLSVKMTGVTELCFTLMMLAAVVLFYPL
ncbi:YwiC-like family protein [Paenibacillus massiliensis]|uniref:YwiC-like family protein n=1 Tax=Paenibacillus massiliensis TaxID=225917 RepID=UPI00042712B8|nr:YwiC-like family protein [Paenibacillus massiliensis]